MFLFSKSGNCRFLCTFFLLHFRRPISYCSLPIKAVTSYCTRCSGIFLTMYQSNTVMYDWSPCITSMLTLNNVKPGLLTLNDESLEMKAFDERTKEV